MRIRPIGVILIHIMDWSTRHKMKYIGTLIAIALVIIGIFVYQKFIKHTPTCQDKIQNQDEQGIDCGGICNLMCIADTKPLIPLWTRPVHIVGDVYSVVSYIENQNIGNGVKKIPYEIRMYDERNILVAQPIRGETFIGPNDRTAIFETSIKTGNRVPKTAFLKFLEAPQFIRTPSIFNEQNIVISNDVLTDIDTVPKLSAVVKNATLETFNTIPVVALIYDVNGNVIGASQTFIDELNPEESTNVYFTWPEPFIGVPAKREIIPRLDPFIQKITP